MTHRNDKAPRFIPILWLGATGLSIAVACGSTKKSDDTVTPGVTASDAMSTGTMPTTNPTMTGTGTATGTGTGTTSVPTNPPTGPVTGTGSMPTSTVTTPVTTGTATVTPPAISSTSPNMMPTTTMSSGGAPNPSDTGAMSSTVDPNVGGMSGTDGGSDNSPGGGGSVDDGAGFTTCPPPTAGWTDKPIIEFNDDGAWTWYSDERAVVDAANRKIIISSDANGSARNGNVDAVIYDIDAGMGQRSVLGDLDPDDHNNGALLVKPNGEYLAFWAGHNQNCNSYFSNYKNGAWAAAKTFDWTSKGCAWTFNGAQRSVTYNNIWAMSGEGDQTIYNIIRSIDTSPNYLVSKDNGESWTYGGRITSTPATGYVAGYYKYWGNGVDRIDFLATEAHPRDQNNSLYHGYIKGGKSYNSTDEVVDEDITDNNAPDIPAFTTMFKTGDKLGDVNLSRLWNADIMRYPDGDIATIWKGRTREMQGEENPDHRLAYSRFSDGKWTSTYLGKAGPKLYPDEQDYIGLGAAHPNDKRIIFISTTIDPRDDSTDLGKHEIFMGTTCDEGATFSWVPVTENSPKDNLRPIVPAWDDKHMVLLWFTANYSTAQSYDAEVVGMIIENP